MKRLIFAVLVLLVAGVASAQETYSIDLTAPQVASLNNGRLLMNRATCMAKGLAYDCTQAQACVAYNAEGGAACTAAQANAAGCRIYAGTLAGRQAFIGLVLVKGPLASYDAQTIQLDGDDARAFCRSATQAQQDEVCAAFGKSAGCFVCLAWR
jgi:hypothetical protein